MLSTADLFDANPGATAVCELQFRSFGQKLSFSGPCMTLVSNEDFRPVLNMLSTPGEQRVLVVDVGGSLRVGVLGDRLAAIAVQNGWTGLVINGAIRDSAGINALALGVKCLGTTARRTEIERGGVEGQPLRFGEVEFAPGDWVYADQDAVLVSKGALTNLLSDGN